MPRTVMTLVLFLWLMPCASEAEAGFITSLSLRGGIPTESGPGVDQTVVFNIGESPNLWPASLPEMLSIAVTAEDWGRTFSLAAESTPNFSFVAAGLRDGSITSIGFYLTSLDQSQGFGGTAESIDLQGYTISQIDFRADRSIDVVNGTTFHSATFDFYGDGPPFVGHSVPAPAGFVLALSGGVSLLGWSWVRRRRAKS